LDHVIAQNQLAKAEAGQQRVLQASAPDAAEVHQSGAPTNSPEGRVLQAKGARDVLYEQPGPSLVGDAIPESIVLRNGYEARSGGPKLLPDGKVTNPAMDEMKRFAERVVEQKKAADLASGHSDDDHDSVIWSISRSDEVDGTYWWELHDAIKQKYGYGILDDQAIDDIAELSRSTGGTVVELGSGTGYNAALLRAKDLTVDAYDVRPIESGGNKYWYTDTSTKPYAKRAQPWTGVRQGDPSVLANYGKNDILFWSWPDNPEAVEKALNNFPGQYVVAIDSGQNYVGELVSSGKVPWELVRGHSLEVMPGTELTGNDLGGFDIYRRKPEWYPF
jgi:hypothetical protein